jgi:hypothetical protein
MSVVGRFSFSDIIVLVLGECTGVPLCIAGGEAFAHSEWIPATIGWGIGIPLVVAGASFHFWKESVKTRVVTVISRYTWVLVPIAVLLAFIYVVGPNIYRRATEFATPPIMIHDKPISDEFAKAPSQVPVSPPIDLSSGQQKNLFISIVKVFSDLRDQQSELSAIANELVNAPAPAPAPAPAASHGRRRTASKTNYYTRPAPLYSCSLSKIGGHSESARANLSNGAIHMHPVPYPMANHMHPVQSQEIN